MESLKNGKCVLERPWKKIDFFLVKKRVRSLRLVIHIVKAYNLAAAFAQAPTCLREQGQVALSLTQKAMGMVDQKIQAYPLLHSSQGVLYASKVQSHAGPQCCKIFHHVCEYKQGLFSFEAKFFFLSLAESPSRDLKITGYKINNILLMRKWNHTFLLLAITLAWKWQIALLPKDIHFPKSKLVDRMINNYLTRLSQNIVICHCFAGQFGFGK